MRTRYTKISFESFCKQTDQTTKRYTKKLLKELNCSVDQVELVKSITEEFSQSIIELCKRHY